MNNESNLLKFWLRRKNSPGARCPNQQPGHSSHVGHWAEHDFRGDEIIVIKCITCGFLMSLIKKSVLDYAQELSDLESHL
jgi:Zn ribbon nucleic-acid-binding protein